MRNHPRPKRYNHYKRGKRYILLDVESRSRADLKTVGGRGYWLHPSSEVLCLSWYDVTAGGGVGSITTWTPGTAWPWWAEAHKRRLNDVVLVAQNMTGFDRFALERLGWMPHDAYDQWVDSAVCARRAGLPGALDALGTFWLDIPKDKDASKFTKGLSTVRRPVKKTAHRSVMGEAIPPEIWKVMSTEDRRELGALPELTPEALARVRAYCESDVAIMVHGWPLLEPWLDFEPDVLLACNRLNDRGVCYDVELARRLLEEDARNGDQVVREVAEYLDEDPDEVRAAANSPAQFVALTGAPNAQKDTVAAMYAADPDSPSGQLARARMALASIARGKLLAGLARVGSDGRLRDTQRYIGAHTWRWSGQGKQLQNMPKPDEELFGKWEDAEICARAEEVLAGGRATQEEVDLLLRATITAPRGRSLVAADLTGIEARALAWYAQDRVSLETIRKGLDPYCVEASNIYRVPYDQVDRKLHRPAGKVAVLACGYQGWVGAIESMAASQGIDLEAIGVTAKDVVTSWRSNHKETVRFWKDVEDAFKDVIRGDCTPEGIAVGYKDAFVITPSKDGRDVAIWMPSGRPLVYNRCKLHRERDKYRPGKFRESISFIGIREQGRGFGQVWTYGGKLVENIIQAVCREFFAHAFAEAEKSPLLSPVMTVHDELVSECETRKAKQALAETNRILTTPPLWEPGFPLDASGFIARRYRK